MRAAILGCGQVSIPQLRAWSQIEGVEVVALYNRTLSKAQERAREFGISQEHVYSDFEALLQTEKVDFVDVATAPQAHRELVEAAAAHGLPALCQKPMATDLEDARLMISACNKAGILFSINENWRWRSHYREVKHLLDQGIIGQPRFVRFTSHRNITLPGPGGGQPVLLTRQAYTATMDQLIVFEWGTHLIDTTRFLFGNPERIYARMERVSPYFRGEDRAVITLELLNLTGLIDISWATVGDEAAERRAATYLEDFTVEGETGSIEILPEPQKLLRVCTRTQSWEQAAYPGTWEEEYQASYTAAQRHFYECLRTGGTPETTAQDNLKTLEITFAAYESAARGQAIVLA